MTDPYVPSEELWSLCAAAIESRLTDADAARLEQLVLADPAARKFYAEYVGVHAALTWSAAEPRVLAERSIGPTTPTPVPVRRTRWAGWAVAAGLLLAVAGVSAAWALAPGSAANTVATLTDAKSCKWESGTLPTEPGARLAAGRLRLAEGVARIAFDSGADVRIEGPAELEVVSGVRCVLHAGRLVANVSPPAIGFVVDTPTAVLTDLGTEFGVNVRDGKTADVEVFNGVVDGTHRGNGNTVRMTTGQNRRFASDGVATFDPFVEGPPNAPRPPPGAERLTLTTGSGKGKDAYVYAVADAIHRSDEMMLVKNTLPTKYKGRIPYDRKGYIGIDLSPTTGRRVLDAELMLTPTATGMGFASEVSDATFAVYGLTDETLDGWDEKAIQWDTAPANRPGGAALDPEKVVLVGRFDIPQGVYTGTRSVGGPALAEFLNRDTNGTATFILVRETVGSGRSDLVHGFANKRHPTLPPPTLKVTVAK